MRRTDLALAVSASLLVAACSSSTTGSSGGDQLAKAVPAPRAGEVTFYLGLPYDTDGLAKAVRAAADPRSSTYRRFAGVLATGERFGAGADRLTAITGSVASLGLSVEVDPTRVFARVSATPDGWKKALGSALSVQAATSSSPFTTYTLPTQIPDALEPAGTSILSGTSQLYDPAADIGTRRTGAQKDATSAATTTTPAETWPSDTGTPYQASCSAPILEQRAVYTPAQVATAYGVDRLRAQAGDVTPVVTILDIGGGWSAKDLQLASECFGYTAPAVHQTQGDGVPTAITQANDETTLDIQTVAAVVPDADLRLVQTVAGTGAFLDGFSRALAEDRFPDVVSVSYGACALAEKQGLPAYTKAVDAVLGTAAVAGVGVYIAAGDSGSTTCGTQVKGPSLSYPAVSSFVTAVGGTRIELGAGNRLTDEVVWNDARYGTSAAGGGGTSATVAPPWFQQGRSGASMRTVPDVSALAAIVPGWPIVLDGGLTTVGGTSGATPFTAAAASIVSAHERAQGRPPVGLAVGWLYAADDAAFRDVTQGDNDLLGVGCCTAKKGYDTASGLGSPDWATLPGTLPAARG